MFARRCRRRSGATVIGVSLARSNEAFAKFGVRIFTDDDVLSENRGRPPR
jgi:hypothetical protein